GGRGTARVSGARTEGSRCRHAGTKAAAMIRAVGISLLLSLFVLQDSPFSFEDATSKSGIRFQNVFGSPDKTPITDVNGSGSAFLDYDRDGLVDIYLVNGSKPGVEGPGNALYRNSGNGVFVDVTDKAGVRDRRWGLGVVAADYDNDGWTDLYVTN